MTKPVITGIALAAAICGMALAGCGGGEERAGPGAMPVVREAEALPSGGPIIEEDAYDWIDRSLDKDLVNLAKELELPELPDKPDDDRFEFRLWTGLGGNIDSRVLAVRADGREFRADYVVHGWRDGGMKVIEKGTWVNLDPVGTASPFRLQANSLRLRA